MWWLVFGVLWLGVVGFVWTLCTAAVKRFDVRGTEWRLQERTDGLGMFVFAEDADLAHKRYLVSAWLTITLIVVGMLLTALLIRKTAPAPIGQPSCYSKTYEKVNHALGGPTS
jgi:hypothetical protein